MPYPVIPQPYHPAAATAASLNAQFPNLNAGNIWVLGNATTTYNCIAWSVGVTTAWLWPGATLAHFTTFYNTYGANPMVNGGIAAYALNNNQNNMTHGATFLNITAGGIGQTWTSKLGQLPLVTHAPGGLNGGTYGAVFQRYGPQPPMEEHFVNSVVGQKGAAATVYTLSADEVDALERRITAVSPTLANQFAAAYAAWVATWDDPLVAISSDPAARAQSKEFQTLIAMGPEIIPLLMGQLRNEDEFFALQAVERLVVPQLVYRPEIESEAFLTGEQGRAAETLRRWLEAVSGTPVSHPAHGTPTTTPYMSQANAVGQGFDVYGQLDMSSLITPLFDPTKAPTQTFTFLGSDYLIPAYITPVEDTRGYYSGGTYESRDSLQTSIAAHAGVNIGYGAFSGEMKADYSGEFNQNTHYAYAYNNFYAPLAYLQLNNAEQYLSDDFIRHLAALPDTFNPANDAAFVAFFQRYGGYYTRRVTLGGSFSFYVSVEQSAAMSQQSIEFTFNAQYNGLVNSGGIDASVKVSQAWESYTQASKTHIFISGGDPTRIAALEAVQNDPLNPSPDTVSRYNAWAGSIAANPAIVDYTLNGIWELCGSKASTVQQAWQEYSQYHRPRLTINTQSETMNWYGSSQLPAPVPPIITLSGNLLKPEEAPVSPTGYQLIVLQNDGSAITDPGAILFNQYYSLPLETDWWDTYPGMYQQLAEDLQAFAGSSDIVILVSFGMSANMPPTNDAYTQLMTCGAGDRLTNWENNSDPGSGSWVQYPVDYILVSNFGSGPNQGIEIYNRGPWNMNQLSDQLEIFLYKQSDDEPYTLGM